jgi:hypothetical protein
MMLQHFTTSLISHKSIENEANLRSFRATKQQCLRFLKWQCHRTTSSSKQLGTAVQPAQSIKLGTASAVSRMRRLRSQQILLAECGGKNKVWAKVAI